MARIVEKILEPGEIYVGSVFKLKIKVEDELHKISKIITEDGKKIKTEDNKYLRTEWGETNG